MTSTTVGCALVLDVPEACDAVLSVAPARVASEQLSVQAREVVDQHGSRLHLLRLPAGRVDLRYDATVTAKGSGRPVRDLDAVEALRPSRYCASDQLGAFAAAELAGASVDEVVDWVFERLVYDGQSTRPGGTALDTLLSGRGVCRDFAHLVVALLRGLDVPARVASVYAPGLSPMDFHLVAEVAVDGWWELHDATHLAPRPSLVRIATGRDAADTAFLTTSGADITVVSTEIWASTDGPLPRDAPTRLS